MNLIDRLDKQGSKKKTPTFHVGDTINVHVRIHEGNRDRIQVFTGTVIARRGGSIRETFTVRRIVQGEGVERIFPLHSPRIEDIKVERRGRVRRAKLYYLRDRVGKAVRVREKMVRRKKKSAPAAGAARPEGTPPAAEAAAKVAQAPA